MILKEAKYKKVRRTVEEYEAPPIHGCDCCKKQVDRNDVLELRAFHKDGTQATSYIFCSWKCVIKALPAVPCDYFIDLPFLHYDDAAKGRTADDFFKAIGIPKKRTSK